MSHRAAMYSVRVREKWKRDIQPRLLGDIDDAGTSLTSELDRYMQGFEAYTEDREKVVRCLSSIINGRELRLMLQHGQTGLSADIVCRHSLLSVRPPHLPRVCWFVVTETRCSNILIRAAISGF
jgi:hypothetical protein